MAENANTRSRGDVGAQPTPPGTEQLRIPFVTPTTMTTQDFIQIMMEENRRRDAEEARRRGEDDRRRDAAEAQRREDDRRRDAAEAQRREDEEQRRMEETRRREEDEKKREDRFMLLIAEMGKTSGNQSEPTTMGEYRVMPDLTQHVPCFDGIGGGEKATTWLHTLKSTAELHQWPDTFKLHSACGHLTGAAQNWYDARSFKTWDEFVIQFQRSFVGTDNRLERWTRATERQQRKGEDTQSYFHNKVLLCQGIGLSFAEEKQLVVTGLSLRALAYHLMAREHVDRDELLGDIRLFETVDAKRAERYERTPKPTPKIETRSWRENAPRVKIENTTVAESGVAARETSGPTPKMIKCFNCAGVGHLSKDCPEPRRVRTCYGCNQDGHVRRDCPRATPASTAAQHSQKLITTADQDANPLNKLLKSATVNCVTINAMLDPGSSSCTMRASAAIRCGLATKPTTDVLYGFGNVSCESARALGESSVDIEIDSVTGRDVKVLVVADNAQPVDLLVGRTWTELPYIAYMRKGDVLKIGYHDEPPFKDLDLPVMPEPRIRLRAEEVIQLEQNTMHFVSAKSGGLENAVGVFDVDGRDCLLQLVNGVTTIPISSEANRVLKKGTVITRGEIVEIVDTENQDPPDPSVKSFKLTDVRVDPTIEPETRCALDELLLEFSDLFATSLEELGCTVLGEMQIREVEGARPVQCRPYKSNSADREAIKSTIQEWKKCGIVTETRSPYASPVLLVRKKTGEHRVVVDYRRLNAQTVKEKFPLPSIDEQMEKLSGCSIFTVLDLAHGYLQVPLAEDARAKTAFITQDETGEFTRMIFGLANGPPEFQRIMNRALGSLRNSIAMCYMDDILIPAFDWKDMLQKLRLVFEAMRKAKLTLRISKCEFGKRELEYLGFIVSAGELKPGHRKMEAITEFPQPKDVHQIRRFLGITGFFRRFLAKYAEVAEPLTRLTKKSEQFKWGDDQAASFLKLKEALTSGPTLKLYDPEARTELHTDASAEGLAGMLLQEGKDDKLHLVYCVSKKTTPEERQYHSSKLELMAIVWSVDRLRQFLLGIEFTIVTDCQALVYLHAMKTKNPQVARWSHLLQEYSVKEIRHRAGAKMSHVDALSRAPVEPCADTMSEAFDNRLEMFVLMSREEQVLTIQRSDDDLKEVIQLLQKEDLTAEEKNKVRKYELKDGLLRRCVQVDGEPKMLFVIPKTMRKSIVVRHHDMMGHFGLDRTASLVLGNYWFPKLRNYVKQHINQCFDCILTKKPSGKQAGFLHPIPSGRRPFATVHLDHLGPFVTSSRNNKELLVMVDNATKYVHLYPARSTTSSGVLKAMKDFVLQRGLPETLITDRGTCFTSQAFESYCTTNGIKHVLNSSRHPRANGQVERVNRTLIPMIAMAVQQENERDWDSHCKVIERNLNNTINKTTGKTPFQLLHGYVPRFHDGALRDVTVQEGEDWTDPAELQEEARERVAAEQRKMKAAFDRKKTIGPKYDVGEVVFMQRAPQQTGQPTKTQAKYRGPLVVTQVLPSDTYRVSQLADKSGGHFYATTAHCSQLKGWKTPGEGETELMDDEIVRDEDEPTPDEGETEPPDEETVRDEDESLVRREPRSRNRPAYLNDYQ